MGFLAKLVQTAGAIEQRILGVQMQMNEVSVRHGDKLPRRAKPAQGRDVHKPELTVLDPAAARVVQKVQ
jgi:hypothetical protein